MHCTLFNVLSVGSAISGNLEFSDDAGNVLASMEKKTTCKDSTAVVGIKNNVM